MLQFLRTPAVAVLTFLVGSATFGATLRADMVPVGGGQSSSESTDSGGSGGGSGNAHRCGNNVIESLEQCDDGNGDNEDNCSNLCFVARCGDGIKQSGRGEECDDGPSNGLLNYCPENCKRPQNTSASCGNGNREYPEECDEGPNNGSSTASCTASCKKVQTASCGNGAVEWPEECDDGNSNDIDGCGIFCKYARCGDGKTQQYEECDDGNTEHADDCSNVCRKARCGDAVLQPGRNEECDQGEINGQPGQCTKDCKKPTNTSPNTYCGNNVTEENEECDDGNYDNGDDCTIACRKAYCGDSILQRNEECDSGKNNGAGICTAECKKTRTTEQGTIHNGIINLPPAPSSISPIDENHSSSASVEMENDFLKRQMEEARKRAEEDERRLQETLRQERERRERESTSGFLGCFNAQGEWTRSRELCDFTQNKRPEIRVIEVEVGRTQTIAPVPMQTAPENKVQEEIRKQLLGNDIAERQRQDLLGVLENAKQRISTLSNQEFAPEVNAYLKSAVEWLDQGTQYFGSGPRTAEEVRMMNEPIRALMSQINDLVSSQKQLPKVMPQINPILEKTETLLNKFRSAFVALAQSGIGLDQNALQAYVEASERFAGIKDGCAQNKRDCDAINEVLEKLKTARPWLEDQLKAHPEVAEKAGL